MQIEREDKGAVGSTSQPCADGSLPVLTDGPHSDGPPQTRRDLAIDIWKATVSQSAQRLSDSLLGDILEVAITDFVAIYKSARGYEIDPVYATALRHDMLIAIEAAARHFPAENSLSGAQGTELTRSARDEPCNSPPSDHVGGEG